jgi:predicted metal-dependent phosphoesterase TrpH
MGKQAAMEEMTATARAEQEKQAQVLAAVDRSLTAIKAKDPKLDENALFTHANKYGFSSLEAAYENMVDIRRTVEATEQRVLKNVGTRKADPIAGGGTPSSAPGAAVNAGNTNQFSSALDFLRSKQ